MFPKPSDDMNEVPVQHAVGVFVKYLSSGAINYFLLFHNFL